MPILTSAQKRLKAGQDLTSPFALPCVLCREPIPEDQASWVSSHHIRQARMHLACFVPYIDEVWQEDYAVAKELLEKG